METPLLVELQNPNFIYNLRALWTLAALVLGAAVAALISTRSGTTLLPRMCDGRSVIPHSSSYSYSSDDDDDSCSNPDDHSDDEDDDDSEETTPPLSDLSSSGDDEEEFQGQYDNSDSVVKFWDEAGFRPGPPCSILTAEAEVEEEGRGSGHLAVVRLWDARSAEVAATWRTEGAVAVAGVGTREERVYVVDGIGRVTVVDLRNVRSAVGEFRRWSDAVVSAGEEAWRRNAAAAAMCLTFFPETG
ncbi:putative formin-like protein 3 isoform X2 [Iris pallida]|uniref:Formin-like protein 3 isoform X2 n=1 Tax=Iris pallida TaxID=29817 RepID=A0AAX6IM36_IRIPA|nr:putative formin-like protein 3 isoform X2 [Iris pallida]